MEILVRGAVALCCAWRRRRRGTCTNMRVKLCQQGFCTALPTIHLANLSPLPNKFDDLLLFNRTNKDIEHSASLSFTETWPSERIPDAGLNLLGFQLYRADHVTELSGKTKGSAIRFYINECWCIYVTVLQKYCSPNLEFFSLTANHFIHHGSFLPLF